MEPRANGERQTEAANEWTARQIAESDSFSFEVDIFISTAKTKYNTRKYLEKNIRLLETNTTNLSFTGEPMELTDGLLGVPLGHSQLSKQPSITISTYTSAKRKGVSVVFYVRAIPWLLNHKRHLKTSGSPRKLISAVIENIDYMLSGALQSQIQRNNSEFKKYLDWHLYSRRNYTRFKAENVQAAYYRADKWLKTEENRNYRKGEHQLIPVAGGFWLIVQVDQVDKDALTRLDDFLGLDDPKDDFALIQEFDRLPFGVHHNPYRQSVWDNVSEYFGIRIQNYYKQLKETGMPSDTALMLTAHVYFPQYVDAYWNNVPHSDEAHLNPYIINSFLFYIHNDIREITFAQREKAFESFVNTYNDMIVQKYQP